MEQCEPREPSVPLKAALEAKQVVLDANALDAFAEEARRKLAKEINDRAKDACQEVNSLVSAALRHLPPEVRALPAREALWIFSNKETGPMQSCAALLGDQSQITEQECREDSYSERLLCYEMSEVRRSCE
mmetsp:Transcript_132831/g.187620  ORF Transcript_132831/g.187620 Transcript_132831/m.187620 type:complete len:131 (-) Transcript_132831:134-526(-)|eukprot:s1629_g5.t1